MRRPGEQARPAQLRVGDHGRGGGSGVVGHSEQGGDPTGITLQHACAFGRRHRPGELFGDRVDHGLQGQVATERVTATDEHEGP